MKNKKIIKKTIKEMEIDIDNSNYYMEFFDDIKKQKGWRKATKFWLSILKQRIKNKKGKK